MSYRWFLILLITTNRFFFSYFEMVFGIIFDFKVLSICSYYKSSPCHKSFVQLFNNVVLECFSSFLYYFSNFIQFSQGIKKEGIVSILTCYITELIKSFLCNITPLEFSMLKNSRKLFFNKTILIYV